MDSTQQQQSPPDVTTLEWVLSPLLTVPGVSGALLVARDGLKLAYTRSDAAGKGFNNTEADKVASIISAFHGLSNGLAEAIGDAGDDLHLGVIKLSKATLFVTGAGTGVPEGTPLGFGQNADSVECTLGVVALANADEGAVGFQMTQMVRSLDEHLRTPARQIEPGRAGQ